MNRGVSAGSGLGCYAVAQSGLGTGRQRHKEELVSATVEGRRQCRAGLAQGG